MVSHRQEIKARNDSALGLDFSACAARLDVRFRHMPHFLAPLSQNTALVGDVFLLDVEIPALGSGPALGAAICPIIHRSYIAEPLARRCGVKGTSGQILTRIKAWSGIALRLHEFDAVPIQFHVANKRPCRV